MSNLLRSNLKKLTMYANNPEIRGWAAGRLLSVAHWLNSDETRGLVRWGVNSWIEAPPLRCADSLEGMLYLLQKHPDIRQGNIEHISERLRRLAWSLPENHDLHLWILLSVVKHTSSGSTNPQFHAFQDGGLCGISIDTSLHDWNIVLISKKLGTTT